MRKNAQKCVKKMCKNVRKLREKVQKCQKKCKDCPKKFKKWHQIYKVVWNSEENVTFQKIENFKKKCENG